MVFKNKSKASIMSQRYTAFTLAEVLITLAIIGVVAALTIPLLITNYQQSQTIESFKKIYSTLDNAVKLSESHNGFVDSWSFPTQHSRDASDATELLNFFNTYLRPYLNIAKSCDTSSGCWTRSKMPNGSSSYCYYGVYGNTIIYYVLNNGTNLFILSYGHTGFDASWAPLSSYSIGIIADINGYKGPNTLGKDVFSFVLTQKAAYVNEGNGNLANNIPVGGLYPDGYGINITGAGYYEYRGCGKDVAYYGGSYCSEKLIQDGYQIKSDYPW